MQSYGSFSEEGIINNLKKSGYTYKQCICELISNSIDAKSTKIIFYITNDNVYILDNGLGMDFEKMKNMFVLFNSNHQNEKVMGVSGIGGKASSLILSNDTEVKIISNNNTTVVPWDKIVTEKKYLGKIEIRESYSFEKLEYDNLMKTVNLNSKSGVIIKFKYNENLFIEVKNFFEVEKNNWKVENFPGIIFGNFDCSIDLIIENDLPQTLKKYNYFSRNTTEYYTGLEEFTIYHCYSSEEKNIFILQEGNKKVYFKQTKAGTSIHPKEFPETKFRDCEVLCELKLKVGMLENTDIFDKNNKPDNFYDITSSISPNSLDLDFFYFNENSKVTDSDLRNFFALVYLKRNNQIITGLETNKKWKNAAGHFTQMLKHIHIRLELSYEVLSSQDNKTDIILKIQGNKNQHSKDLPKNLIRIIEHIREYKFQKIKRYFEYEIENDIILEPKIEIFKEEVVIPEPKIEISEEENIIPEPKIEISEEENIIPEPKIEISDEENIIPDPEIEISDEENIIPEPEIEISDEENIIPEPEIEISEEENIIPEPEIEISDEENIIPEPEIEISDEENIIPEPEIFKEENIIPEPEISEEENIIPEPEIERKNNVFMGDEIRKNFSQIKELFKESNVYSKEYIFSIIEDFFK